LLITLHPSALLRIPNAFKAAAPAVRDGLEARDTLRESVTAGKSI
jgi:hypothetical protein